MLKSRFTLRVTMSALVLALVAGTARATTVLHLLVKIDKAENAGRVAEKLRHINLQSCKPQAAVPLRFTEIIAVIECGNDEKNLRLRVVGPEAVGLWAGHGGFTPGSAVTVQMMQRFSNIYGCQAWHPAMICWGLGGFGVGLTGALKVNTKEDMAENSRVCGCGGGTDRICGI